MFCYTAVTYVWLMSMPSGNSVQLNVHDIIDQEDARILTRQELILKLFSILYIMNYNPPFH